MLMEPPKINQLVLKNSRSNPSRCRGTMSGNTGVNNRSARKRCSILMFHMTWLSYFSATHRFSYAMKTLITNWISFLQIGHEAPVFFSLLAQWKQVVRWLVLPWMMFPSRGLFSHKLHGFKMFWQSSMFSVSVLCSKRWSACSPMLEMVSWLSELWAKSKNSTELQGSKSLEFSSFL